MVETICVGICLLLFLAAWAERYGGCLPVALMILGGIVAVLAIGYSIMYGMIWAAWNLRGGYGP